MKNTFLPKENRPLLIAGPCSVESEEQLLSTAKRLQATGKVDMIRGGIWKPRTRPNAFEGVGAIGLPWMKRVKEETGLPVTTEVAKASHVDLCLEFDIDVLWIGARTTVNPFAVQEIADALKGVDIPIMVKNPINPDLGLWLGAVERLQKAGLKKIGAIHRGFSFSGEKFYRNRPQWQYAIDFKQEMPDVPMINDPSHICGRRDILQKVSQKAMDLNMDGLMIESHIDPDKAWSDAKQQITPEVYGQMMKDLVLREYDPTNNPQRSELEKLRKQINLIDDELISILSSRMAVARDIGTYKKENNITILQSAQWQKILNKYKVRAKAHDLSDGFITRFIKAVHDESINQQENIFEGK
jgi:chorismate mutase